MWSLTYLPIHSKMRSHPYLPIHSYQQPGKMRSQTCRTFLPTTRKDAVSAHTFLLTTRKDAFSNLPAYTFLPTTQK